MTPIDFRDQIFYKREDQNVTGSTKDRALRQQISNLISLGYSEAVISSSGNAAISAAYYCRIYKIKLTIFISSNVSKPKLGILQTSGFSLNTSPTPNRDSFRFAKLNHAYNLRSSTDPQARLGYQSLGSEIALQLPKVTSIFIPVGSGTTLLGLSDTLPPHIPIFAVQPSANPTICAHFDQNFSREAFNPTPALSIKLVPLQNEIWQTISNRHGSGLVIQSSAILSAHRQLLSMGFNVSTESGLALAGYDKAKSAFSSQIGKNPLIILTGTQR